MTDADYPIQQIKERVLAFAKERDWEQFHSPKNLSMAISAEAAELMEHFLWQSPEQSRVDMQDPQLRAKVEEELADILIFAIQFANVTKIDLAAAIQPKCSAMLKNIPSKKPRGEAISILNCSGLCLCQKVTQIF